MVYGDDKALQQHLIDNYGIKIHKNVLRHKDYINYDEKKDDPVGNITYDVLQTTLNNINPTAIPSDWGQKHDKTKWSNSKEKTKQRNQRRLDKCMQTSFEID